MFLNDYSHKGCLPMKMALHTANETYSCDVRVKEKDRYGVFFEYIFASNADEERNAVREAVGDSVFKGDDGNKGWTKQSHPIKAEVTISAIDKNNIDAVASRIVEPEISILGPTSAFAELIRHELEPGTYRITVKNLKGVPALQSINTNIVFQKAYEGN